MDAGMISPVLEVTVESKNLLVVCIDIETVPAGAWVG
jgi:hypothetical protein